VADQLPGAQAETPAQAVPFQVKPRLQGQLERPVCVLLVLYSKSSDDNGHARQLRSPSTEYDSAGHAWHLMLAVVVQTEEPSQAAPAGQAVALVQVAQGARPDALQVLPFTHGRRQADPFQT